MKHFRLACLTFVIAACSSTAMAGGLLTNTNQNVSFLRNPARDAAIGIDGIYTNPAGVAFLSEGFHLSLNWQWAHQTRTVNTAYGDLFTANLNNPAVAGKDGFAYHKFKGVADAPVLPSIQAAYNKGRWSFQAGIAVSGGGGKCEFDNGLGSFEGILANMVPQLNNQLNASLGLPAGVNAVNGYALDSYMRGKQYYFGFTLGAAYKITPNLAVFGGARVLYGTAQYVGYLHNISLAGAITGGQAVPATNVFAQLKDQAANAASQYAAAGYSDIAAQYAATARQMGVYEEVTKGIDLDCKQSGIGVAPFIGIDYKAGRWNLAAKYDFKVRMRLENENGDERFNTIAAAVPQLSKFVDGNKVAEDSPGMLTLGAQYEVTDKWRVMAGYHRFFDVDTKQYNGSTLGDTQELNIGTEVDITKAVQVSGGLQKTIYDMEDAFMSDISFNVSSYTFGLGVGVQVSKKVKLNAAYFQTNYDTKHVSSYSPSSVNPTVMVKNNYTRTNRVVGLGCDIDF